MFICLVIGGYLSDRYGRRIVCISGTYVAIISSIIMVFPKSLIVFIVCRISAGFGAGIVNILAGECGMKRNYSNETRLRAVLPGPMFLLYKATTSASISPSP
jgi:MFS family permease